MAKRERIYRGFVPDDDGDRTIRIDGEQIRGRWVYGGPPKPGEAEPDREGLPVIPETVGEWTGLTDRAGNKIYEDDIIEACLNPANMELYGSVCTKTHLMMINLPDTQVFMWNG